MDERTGLVDIDLVDLKKKILELLSNHPRKSYSVDELVNEFGQLKWIVNKAVSQLHDERTVTLHVKQKRKVYVSLRR